MTENNSNRNELPDDRLADEAEIVWLESTQNLAYIREKIILMPFRTKSPRKGIFFRLIGYATLKPKSRSKQGYFHRRVFWLASHDWPLAPGDVYADGGCPCEGVDPSTVKPGAFGRVTERCQERRQP